MNYALVDPAMCTDALAGLQDLAQAGRARSLLAHQPEAKHAFAGPWLVSADDGPHLRRWLDHIDLTLGAVSRLSSTHGFSTVFRQLESRLDLRLADGRRALLRFWDGRALYAVWSVMTLQQRRLFLAPFSQWTVRFSAATWVLDHSLLGDGAC